MNTLSKLETQCIAVCNHLILSTPNNILTNEEVSGFYVYDGNKTNIFSAQIEDIIKVDDAQDDFLIYVIFGYVESIGVYSEMMIDFATYGASGEVFHREASIKPPTLSDVSLLLRTAEKIKDIRPQLSSILLLAVKTFKSHYKDVSYAIDYTAYIRNRIFVHGWLENCEVNIFYIFSDDLSTCFLPDAYVYRERTDVSDLIEIQGKQLLTNRHGFSASAPRLVGQEHVVYRIFIGDDTELAHIGDFKSKFLLERSEAIKVFWSFHSNGVMPDTKIITNIISPLLEEKFSRVDYEIFTFSNTKINPRLSIIIPFYGEWYFIRSLLVMAKKMGSETEWIFVCDDPRIAAPLSQYLSDRVESLSASVKLIINSRNYGYSIANNIGVSACLGNVVLLMNSDIWIDDPDSLYDSVEMIEAKTYNLIGFRLLFEDGSIQHDGISCIKNRKYRGLYLAEHPGKGLPPKNRESLHQQTRAVTGALMMLDKHTFDHLGGFDKSYIRGDFEDVDLCLKFIASGNKVGIVRRNDYYHLERQSIRSITASSLREAITLTNCVYFNKKWHDLLNKQNSNEFDSK